MQHDRITGLDVFRGWAIILMIVFHFSYDLWYFHLVDFDIIHDPFWVYFRYLIVSTFMISVGVSLGIVHTPVIRWKKVAKRALILGAATAAVSIATKIQSPHEWVYFGILHLVFVTSLVGLAFVHYPKIALGAAAMVFVLSTLDMTGQHALYDWARPIFNLPYRTEDLARFFPWFGVVLMGIAGYGLRWHEWFFGTPFLSAHNKANNALALLGRHSLMIYLVHIPILYGIVMVVAKYTQ